jgi:C-terminal processing protease CtpA/Prc
MVNLGETPISQFLAKEVSSEFFGFSVKELTQDVILNQRLEGDGDGLWVSRVERGGWADVAGLRVGDLLMEINKQKTTKIDEIETLFDNIENENREYVMLLINRRGQTQFLFMDIRKEINK